MQSIEEGGFLPAAAAGEDRRLRPHRNDNQNPQSLKCPRCDSLNTKFCYYNNYNLSQPRHFCRTCRRYWTKGGILRNVPVGGRCRKTKRSKPKNSPSAAATTAPPPAQSSSQQKRELKASTSHSSSENSSLTAAVTTEVVSAPSSNSASNNLLDNLQDSSLFVHSSPKPSSEPGVTEQGVDSGIFSEIENLTSLVAPTNENLAFGYGNITDASSFQLCGQWQKGMNTSDRRNQELKWPEMTATGWLMEETVAVDWRARSDDQGFFDVGNTLDEGVWSHNQWNEDNSSLFHLP
ncbi:hypothetical protein QN277_014544 [Acacia crassicarpa]|uniref:Dof zinc finger protein n=1 Tax=Acacia crassicarpa TaxID=499986 RepID=A0AAE1JGA6_9FABA|nr:hypothetical protein QN277_014544 [Acacia crassicarpa]